MIYVIRFHNQPTRVWFEINSVFLQIDADDDTTNTKDDDDVEEVSQPMLKALNAN